MKTITRFIISSAMFLSIIASLFFSSVLLNAQNLETSFRGGSLGGNFGGAASKGNYSFITIGLNLLTLYNEGKEFTVVSTTPIKLAPSCLYVSGDYLYMFIEGFGLDIYDVSNPLSPIKAVTYSLINYSTDQFVVSGNYVFLPFSGNGFKILDISNPSIPKQVFTSNSIKAKCVFVLGNHCYIIDNSKNANLLIYDIGDPADPKELSVLSIGSGSGLFAKGNHLFIAGSSSGFITVDVSNPANPQKITYPPGNWAGLDIIVDGNILYCIDQPRGWDPSVLHIINIQDINNPVELGTLTYNEGIFRKILLKGNKLYLINDLSLDAYLEVDISNPSAPKVLKKYTSPVIINSFDISGSEMYASSFNKICRFNIENPENVVLEKIYNNIRGGRLQLYGNLMITMKGDTLFINDISDYNNPVVHGFVKLPKIWGNYAYGIRGNYIYIFELSPEPHIRIIDISNPAAPVQKYLLNLASAKTGRFIKAPEQSDYIIVGYDKTSGNPETAFIDVSNAENPVIRKTYETSGSPVDYFQLNKTAFLAYNVIAQNKWVIEAIDISDMANPVKLDEISGDNTLSGMFSGGNVIVALSPVEGAIYLSYDESLSSIKKENGRIMEEGLIREEGKAQSPPDYPLSGKTTPVEEKPDNQYQWILDAGNNYWNKSNKEGWVIVGEYSFLEEAKKAKLWVNCDQPDTIKKCLPLFTFIMKEGQGVNKPPDTIKKCLPIFAEDQFLGYYIMKNKFYLLASSETDWLISELSVQFEKHPCIQDFRLNIVDQTTGQTIEQLEYKSYNEKSKTALFEMSHTVLKGKNLILEPVFLLYVYNLSCPLEKPLIFNPKILPGMIKANPSDGAYQFNNELEFVKDIISSGPHNYFCVENITLGKLYGNIPEALDEASLNNTIEVCRGSYQYDTRKDEGIIIRPNARGLHLRSKEGKEVTVLLSTDPLGSTINLNTEDVTIAGFTISSKGSGIVSSHWQINNIKINNNRFENCKDAILIYDGTKYYIQDNEFINNSSNINFSFMSECEITGNIITCKEESGTSWGIFAHSFARLNAITHNIIDLNFLEDSPEKIGIYLNSAFANTIAFNQIRHCLYGILISNESIDDFWANSLMHSDDLVNPKLIPINPENKISYNVISKSEFGVALEKQMKTKFYRNHFLFNRTGIFIGNSSKTFMSVNRFSHNKIGLHVFRSDQTDMFENIYDFNGKNIETTGKIHQNNANSDQAYPTAILLDSSYAQIKGNEFFHDSTGITILKPNKSIVHNNNFIGAGNHAMINFSDTEFDAKENFWNSADGPGGDGHGTGTSISGKVNFADFLTEAVDLVIYAEADTLFVPENSEGQVMFFLQNWSDRQGGANLTITEDYNWLADKGEMEIMFQDSLGAVASLTYSTPSFISGELLNVISAEAVSLKNQDWQHDANCVLALYKPELEKVVIIPDSVYCLASVTFTLIALGADQHQNLFPVDILWQAEGGTIDEYGKYIAGDIPGTYQVIAQDKRTGMKATSYVVIEGALSSVNERHSPKNDLNNIFYNVYPNPFSEDVSFRFKVERSSNVMIIIYNQLGQEVAVPVNEWFSEGVNEVKWEPEIPGSGIFIYKIILGNQFLTGKVVRIK